MWSCCINFDGPEAAPSPSTALQVVAVLQEGDADELAAGADAHFGEELLDGGLYRTFGNAKFGGDLLICHALDEETEDLLVAFGETDSRSVGHLDEFLQVVLFDEHLALKHLLDTAAEFFGGLVFVEDTADAEADEFDGVLVGESGGDEEDLAAEARSAEAVDEWGDGFAVEFEIEDEDIDGEAEKVAESGFGGAGGTGDIETGFAGE